MWKHRIFHRKHLYKINHTGFKELAYFGIKTFYEDKSYGTWRGYRLPDSEDIITKFGLFNKW